MQRRAWSAGILPANNRTRKSHLLAALFEGRCHLSDASGMSIFDNELVGSILAMDDNRFPDAKTLFLKQTLQNRIRPSH